MIEASESANRILDTIPLIMAILRREIRQLRPADVSVPQFRVLAYLSRHDGATLTDVSNHIGLMRPTMSKMVEGLVRRGWVSRNIPPENRRCVSLGLTEEGKAVMGIAREGTRQKLASILVQLTPEEQETVQSAMQKLNQVFGPEIAARQKER